MKNLTIFQFFHWYYTPEGKLWLHAGEKAPHLKKLGVTHVWLPPAYKSSGGLDDPGYAVYDISIASTIFMIWASLTKKAAFVPATVQNMNILPVLTLCMNMGCR